MTDAARGYIEKLFDLALERADPRKAVSGVIEIDGVNLEIGPHELPVRANIVLISIGKAAVTMAHGAIDALGDRIGSGIAITKDGHAGEARFDRVDIAEAAHPIPDARGVAATRSALELVARSSEDDLILCLISGGGSALFEAPREPVTLEDLASITRQLLRAGADITDLNRVRTPLSLVKGGGFLRAAGGRSVVTVIVSDVLGNDPHIIASGPTVPGPDDPEGARAVLETFGLWDDAPGSIKKTLARKGDKAAIERQTYAPVIVADNHAVLECLAEQVIEDGGTVESPFIDATGEAREQGVAWAERCLQAERATGFLLGGGELTVTVRGDGVGGRNTEFALAAAARLHLAGEHDWVVASLTTDGQDGPTGVAGAILSADDIERMSGFGFDIEEVLERNDSLTPILAVGAEVAPGPTGTNVNDLYFAVRRSALKA
jgi:hydroxypyruvate reductase